MSERHVMIVTGAGASRALGKDHPMPLMFDWAASLRTDIDAQISGASRILGLTENIQGDEFEIALGKFLAYQAYLPELHRLMPLGYPNRTNDQSGQVQQWFTWSQDNCSQVVEIIRSNLFRTFGPQNVDLDKAASAYSALVTWMQDSKISTRLAFATTNYDLAIEMALTRSSGHVLDGFSTAPWQTSTLDASKIVSSYAKQENAVPILHLHGAVGWYRDTEGRIKRYPGDLEYQPNYGSPALLLPDSTKTRWSLAGGEQLWDAFIELLAGCSHVIVLGHSLHDQHLIDILNEAQAPTAVLHYSSERNFVNSSAYDLASGYVQQFLPSAETVLCDFGPKPRIDLKRLHRWLAETDGRHGQGN